MVLRSLLNLSLFYLQSNTCSFLHASILLSTHRSIFPISSSLSESSSLIFFFVEGSVILLTSFSSQTVDSGVFLAIILFEISLRNRIHPVTTVSRKVEKRRESELFRLFSQPEDEAPLIRSSPYAPRWRLW